MDYSTPDITYPDRRYCAVEGCYCLQRNRGKGYGWGLLCDKHHKANRGLRMEEKQIALETTRIARQEAKEAKRVSYRNRPERVCSKCGVTKPKVEFNRQGNVCKSCAKLHYKPRKQRKRNPIIARRILLRTKYGVDIAWYNTKFVEQNGCCAICGRHQKEFKTTLAVDHNHTTGEVRGLLCSGCNLLLGKMESTPFIVEKMQLYLNKHNRRQAVS